MFPTCSGGGFFVLWQDSPSRRNTSFSMGRSTSITMSHPSMIPICLISAITTTTTTTRRRRTHHVNRLNCGICSTNHRPRLRGVGILTLDWGCHTPPSWFTMCNMAAHTPPSWFTMCNMAAHRRIQSTTPYDEYDRKVRIQEYASPTRPDPFGWC